MHIYTFDIYIHCLVLIYIYILKVSSGYCKACVAGQGNEGDLYSVCQRENVNIFIILYLLSYTFYTIKERR